MKAGAVLSFISALCSGLSAAIWPGLIKQLQETASNGAPGDYCRVLLHVGIYAAIGETEYYKR